MISAFALAFGSAFLTTAPAPNRVVSRVRVERSGERWFADYRFDRRAPVWLFVKSALPRGSERSWRQGSVRVLTPGVRLVRLRNYDALVTSRGVLPTRVRLQFTPSREVLETGYDPTLTFSDGAVALYGDQFWTIPARSISDVRALGRGEGAMGRNSARTRMIFRDSSGPVLAYGKLVSQAAMDDGATYVLFGRVRPVIGPVMTSVIDPATPAWLSQYLIDGLPEILGRYQRELGPLSVRQLSLLVTWDGRSPAQRSSVSLSGSVLPGLVLMAFSGSVLQERSESAARSALWFVSHEAAHFWLGQAVSYTTPAESWITEGGAELLALRATAAADPTFDVGKRLAEARAECAPFLRRGGLASAYQRGGDFRAYYACGILIALAAERANDGDFSKFVRALIAGPGKDGEVSRDEWLRLLDERVGSEQASKAVAELLDRPQPDPHAALDRFVAETSIGAQFSAQADVEL